MELFYSLCCSELSCSPHCTPFTLYQWRPLYTTQIFKIVFIWDRQFWPTAILTESRINLVWSFSTHCVVLSWVALLIARLLHFINGDRPARWRVPLFTRRCPLGCLGSKIFEFDNGHSNVLISTYLPSSLRKLFLKTTFLFKLV